MSQNWDELVSWWEAACLCSLLCGLMYFLSRGGGASALECFSWNTETDSKARSSCFSYNSFLPFFFPSSFSPSLSSLSLSRRNSRSIQKGFPSHWGKENTLTGNWGQRKSFSLSNWHGLLPWLWCNSARDPSIVVALYLTFLRLFTVGRRHLA